MKQNFQNFCIRQGLIHETVFWKFFIFQGLIHEKKLPQDHPKKSTSQVESYLLCNKYKSLIYSTFSCFSSSERFLLRSQWCWCFFFLFLLQKDFHIFHVLLFEDFLCVFDNIYLPLLYIQKKSYKKPLLLVSFICLKIYFKIWKLYELFM